MLAVQQLQFKRKDFSLEAHFTLPEGGRLAVMGPSGSGKSTLLSLIAGHELPQQGQITWKNAKVSASLLFQKHNLLPHLTVAQNVGLGLRPSLRFSGSEKDQIDGALQALKMEALKNRLPHELSGGEQQRVALARISLQNRPLVLLDEPFNGLGPGLTHQILEDLFRLQEEKGLTLILTTHNPLEAQLFSEDFLFLDQGQIIERATPSEIFASSHPAIQNYLGPISLPLASPIPCARVGARR